MQLLLGLSDHRDLSFAKDYEPIINKENYMFAICVSKENHYYSKLIPDVYNEEVYFAIYDYCGKLDDKLNFSALKTLKILNTKTNSFEENKLEDSFFKKNYKVSDDIVVYEKIANYQTEAERLKYITLLSNKDTIKNANDCFIYYEIQHNDKIKLINN